MKKIFPIIMIAIAIIAVSCGFTPSIKAKGEVIIQKRELNNFKSVSVSNGITLIVKNGSQQVSIQTHSDIQPYVETFVKNGTLHIRLKEKTSLNDVKNLTAYVTVPTLSDMSASGGGRITFPETFTSTTGFTIDASGGSIISGSIVSNKIAMSFSGGSSFNGVIRCDGGGAFNVSGGGTLTGEIFCGNLAINLSGGSRMHMRGKCESFDVNCSGGSDVLGFGIVSTSIAANISGGGRAEFTTSGIPNVSTSGGSTVIVKNTKGEQILLKEN